VKYIEVELRKPPPTMPKWTPLASLRPEGSVSLTERFPGETGQVYKVPVYASPRLMAVIEKLKRPGPAVYDLCWMSMLGDGEMKGYRVFGLHLPMSNPEPTYLWAHFDGAAVTFLFPHET
jgi:hypothetical protein